MCLLGESIQFQWDAGHQHVSPMSESKPPKRGSASQGRVDTAALVKTLRARPLHMLVSFWGTQSQQGVSLGWFPFVSQTNPRYLQQGWTAQSQGRLLEAPPEVLYVAALGGCRAFAQKTLRRAASFERWEDSPHGYLLTRVPIFHFLAVFKHHLCPSEVSFV